MDVLLAIGTRKGLFTAWSRDGDPFEVGPIAFSTLSVFSIAIDARRQPVRLMAGMESGHFGPALAWSDDLGESWQERPEQAIAYPESTGATLDKVWQLRPSPTEPDVVWAGTEPGGLFRSEDRGETFSLVEGLWEHPHRAHWVPGGGGLGLHTVLPHPTDPQIISAAVSTGGFYKSADGGASWQAANRGIRVNFMPEEYPEFGQCVHKVDFHPSRPERLFLQHHWGVYRSDDFGDSWHSIGDDLPSDFGFPVAVHPEDPDTVYVFPLHADSDRTPTNHRYRVYRSTDAGDSWEMLAKGLPDTPCYGAVMRDAMTVDRSGVYFGTRSGEVYGSRDRGDSWELIADHLPDVFCVRAAVLE